MLDTIDGVPYYAIGIEAGDLGTKGGLVIDVAGGVLRGDGSAVEGLYASGNVSASVMGNEYTGAGATIGPAMVFAHLAVPGGAAERARQAEPAGRSVQGPGPPRADVALRSAARLSQAAAAPTA
ncbi:FAD-binding protein [Streptomyces sp. NPDC055681]